MDTGADGRAGTRHTTGLLLAGLALLLGAACADSGGELCDRLTGASFVSEEMISSILGPDGVEPSNEYIDFSLDDADWLYGDVVEVTPWECRGDRVTFADGRFAADVVDEGGLLVLDRDGTRYLQTD